MSSDSIHFIETKVAFGAFVRGLQQWGASAMVVAIGLHMLQSFLSGAYKPPREVMWMVGVVLFLIVIFSLPGISPKNLYAVPRTDPALVRGRAFFYQCDCVGCDRIYGEGGAIGRTCPSLEMSDQNGNRISNISRTLNRCRLAPSCRKFF
jgi:Cytochrome b/b6/petB